MTKMWPMATPVAPLPGMSRSTNATRRPAWAQANAQAAPTMPPPATTTS